MSVDKIPFSLFIVEGSEVEVVDSEDEVDLMEDTEEVMVDTEVDLMVSFSHCSVGLFVK